MNLKSQATKINQVEAQRGKKAAEKTDRSSGTNRAMPRYLIFVYLKLSVKEKTVHGVENFRRICGDQKFSRFDENCTYVDPRNSLKQK